MPRARNIKPAFFKNEELVELPFETRLAFIGLWTLADREGRLEDRPKRIKMELFPADNVDVDAALSELQAAGFILRYVVDDTAYIQVLNFSKHQNPHKNEAPSSIPAPCEHGASTVQAPEGHGSARADSLNPDSLIPDSLNPETGSTAPDGAESSPRGEDPPPKSGPIPYQAVVDLYHRTLPELPACKKLTEARKGYIRQRHIEDIHNLDQWERYFMAVSRSDFLMGRKPGSADRPPFRADLEWLTKPSNFAKVAEGKYHRATGSTDNNALLAAAAGGRRSRATSLAEDLSDTSWATGT
jgi:hypothetical protein